MTTAYLDEKLILDMAGGSREAFTELYKATSDTVYGLALSILASREDAEDVMHDAYIKAYTSASTYEPQGKPFAWLITIVRNLCYNKIRAQAHTENSIDDQESREPESPTDEIEILTDKMVLDAALRILDKDEREIVMLHAMTGYKHREIADMLGIPQGTVLSKYNRALKKMKKEIEGEEDAE